MNKQTEKIWIESIVVGDNSSTLITDSKIAITDGEITGLIGPNGSGKSIILRYLADASEKTGSSAIVNSSWSKSQFAAAAKGRIAYVGQRPRTNLVTRTVEDELFFSLQAAGLTQKECDDKIEEVATHLNIAHLLSRDTLKLSEGEAQAIALAEAFGRDVKLLLLDEPTAFLDQANTAGFLKILRNFLTSRVDSRVVLSSHDIELIGSVAHKTYEISGGRIRKTRSLDKRYQKRKAVSVRPRKSLEDPPVLWSQTLKYGEMDLIGDNTGCITLHGGSFLAVVGNNGSGKTTLLRILSGLLKKDVKGEVQLHGESLKKSIMNCPDQIYMVNQDADSHIMYVKIGDEFELDDHFSNSRGVNEGMKDVALHNIFDQLLKKENTYSLSEGEKKMLSMRPIVKCNSKVVLFDEPFAHLDNSSSNRVVELMNSLLKNGSCIVVSDHSDIHWKEIGAEIIYLN